MSVALPKTESQPTPPPRNEEEYQPPPSLLMYLAGFIVTFCGLYPVTLTLEDPSFTMLILSLTVIGFLVSYISCQQNISSRTIEFPAAIIFCGVCLLTFISDTSLPLLAPASIEDDRAKSIAVLLTWMVVFRSFTLTTDGRLLFCCVPTIALTGLISTMNSDPVLLNLFLVFLAAATFMVVHENFARGRQSVTGLKKTHLKKAMLAGQFQITALCCAGAIIFANIIVGPMRTVGSTLVFAGALPVQRSSQQEQRQTSTSRFSEQDEYAVATGPVRLSDQVVMRVRAEAGAYWRGTTRDEYTGRGWRNRFPANQRLEPIRGRSGTEIPLDIPRTRSFYEIVNFDLPENELTQVGENSMRLKQSIRLEPGGIFNDIYGASEIREIRISEIRAVASQTGTVHLEEALTASWYEVVSEMPVWTPETLKAASKSYPPIIRQYYLQLPVDSEAMDRVRALSEEVTSDKQTAYEKVVALMQWLGQNCKYNTDTPAAPANTDVVEHFLFTQREGYCDSFATALAVMCRSIGIPARTASGFLPGELDVQSQQYQVRERDKHMWTEVFFPGVGWITFDPTENAEDISPSREKKNASFWGSLVSFMFKRGWLPPLALFAFIVMLAYVIKVEILDKLRRNRTLANPLQLPATNMTIVETYDEACRLLAKKGLPRSEALTASEYLQGTVKQLERWREAQEALERLTALLNRFRYSREVASEEDVRIAKSALAALAASLKPVKRTEMAVALSSMAKGA
jgi:transglutaminase-like putative cysteine protease